MHPAHHHLHRAGGDRLRAQVLRRFFFEWLRALGMTRPVRSVLHRVFAVGMLATGAWHLAYLAFSVKGRAQLKALWFMWEDIRLVAVNLRYHLGLSKERPALPAVRLLEEKPSTGHWSGGRRSWP